MRSNRSRLLLYMYVFSIDIVIFFSISSRLFQETQMQTVLCTISSNIPSKQDFFVLSPWTGILMVELECVLRFTDAYIVSVC